MRDFGADGVAVVLKGDDVPPLPIIIGHCEARALVGAMRDEDFPRPLAYDLLEAMLEKLQGEVMHLVVHSIKDNTFHANLYIETAAGEWVLDCRPSDGMVLVTRLGVPIYLQPRLFETQRPKPTGITNNREGGCRGLSRRPRGHTGGIARAHGKACKQIAEAELVAICDVSAEQLARYGEEFGVAAHYTELDTMLHDRELDIAIVCTWGAFHAETGIQICDSGRVKAVLCEKPFTQNAAEAAAFAAAGRKNRVPSWPRRLSFAITPCTCGPRP